MNLKHLVLFVAISATCAFGAPTKVLLIGESDSKIHRALVGETTISADSIGYDAKAGVLRCTGSVQIRVGTTVVTSSECTVEIDPKASVYQLNPQGIEVKPNQALEPTARAVTPAAGAPVAPATGAAHL